MQDHDYWNRPAVTWPVPARADEASRGTDLDARSLAELKGRSPDAWAELYERHYGHIFGYAYARLGRVSEAEDVVALTFQRALTRIESYSERGKPVLAWLFGIARNVVREQRRHSCALFGIGRMNFWHSENSGDGGRRTQEAGFRHGSEIDERIDLRAAVAALTPNQRDVIVLRYFQGLSVRETADALGKPESAVHSLQARAVASLRRRL